MIAIHTFKTKIGHKKIITIIGTNKLISAKNSDPGLIYHIGGKRIPGDILIMLGDLGIW